MPHPPETTRNGSSAGGAAERDEHLLVRAAWLSYVGGLTQAQIAKRLGINRIRVNRMLAQARDQGIVQIRINSKVADCVALEERLRERFSLAEAIVVPTPPDPDLIPRTIAVAAGEALSSRIREGLSVGVGWDGHCASASSRSRRDQSPASAWCRSWAG